MEALALYLFMWRDVAVAPAAQTPRVWVISDYSLNKDTVRPRRKPKTPTWGPRR